MRELGQKCGLSAPYIAALERNTSEPPPIGTCKALAHGLGLNWEEVWKCSFAGRLRKWLAREGFRRIREEDLDEILRKIHATSRSLSQ